MVPTFFCRFFNVALCVWVGVCSTVAPVALRLQSANLERCGGAKCGCSGDSCGCSRLVTESNFVSESKCCAADKKNVKPVRPNQVPAHVTKIKLMLATEVVPVQTAPNQRADMRQILLCDCGCQRPLPLPEMPASVCDSPWSLILLREYVHSHCYPIDLNQAELCNNRDLFSSRCLVSLLPSERRQAALSRWQI